MRYMYEWVQMRPTYTHVHVVYGILLEYIFEYNTVLPEIFVRLLFLLNLTVGVGPSKLSMQTFSAHAKILTAKLCSCHFAHLSRFLTSSWGCLFFDHCSGRASHAACMLTAILASRDLSFIKWSVCQANSRQPLSTFATLNFHANYFTNTKVFNRKNFAPLIFQEVQ